MNAVIGRDDATVGYIEPDAVHPKFIVDEDVVRVFRMIEGRLFIRDVRIHFYRGEGTQLEWGTCIVSLLIRPCFRHEDDEQYGRTGQKWAGRLFHRIDLFSDRKRRSGYAPYALTLSKFDWEINRGDPVFYGEKECILKLANSRDRSEG